MPKEISRKPPLCHRAWPIIEAKGHQGPAGPTAGCKTRRCAMWVRQGTSKGGAAFGNCADNPRGAPWKE